VSHALRQRLARVGLAGVLLAGVLGVSFGSGYRASQAVLDDGTAHLTKGHTVVRVNGESGQVEAQLTASVASGRQRVRVVELADGQVYVENVATGERSKVDTTTMTPQPLPRTTPGSLVGGGSEMYAVDRRTGAVSWIHARTRQSTLVATLGPVQGEAVDSRGTAWVLAGGRLHEIARSEQRPAREVGGGPALLTLVGDRPTVLRPDAGEVVRFGRTAGEVQRVPVPDLAGRPVGQLAVAAPGAGEVLWVAVRAERRLVRVDLPAGRATAVDLPQADQQAPRNGPPVVTGDRVLVPDYQARAVHVLDAATGRERKLITGVKGDGDFDVVVGGGKVYLNDQYAREGKVVDLDGGERTIDKGTGDGIPGPRRPAPAAPPSRSPTAPGTDPGPGPAEPAPAPEPEPDPKVRVPDVVGADREAACATLRRDRLDCVPVPVGNDGAGRTGEVLRTAPAAGAEVSPGQVVTVSYRGDIQLPDLVGLPSAAACAALEAAGLRCERTELPAVADPAAVDKVTAQDPPAGAAAQTGDRVRISYPTQVLVPDVRSLAAADACARLAAAQLACTQLDAGTRPAAEPPNVVIDQVPPSGTPAAPGTAVTVRFYSSVVVPQVTGLSPAAAAAAITAAGLTPAPVADLVTNQPNVVQQQSPAPGSAAGPGTPVQFAYEDVAPTQVRLYKREGQFRYSIEPQPGYVDQRLLGLAFPQPAGGTTAVYRYVCDGNRCGGAGTFYYSMTNAPTAGPGWTNAGVAFYAYAQQVNPALRPIKAMFDGAAWVWAVEGTGDHQIYLDRGYTRPEGFTLGWVWPAG
jgi:beta-lactam-binding protein with PASTA domain